MPKKIISGEYRGHKFLVENTWFSGAKLFHNNELIATINATFATNKNVALMSAKVMIDESERLVEVFIYALLTTKIQIKIDGEKIAGDVF